ncbi:MAG: AAA family ATPase, partial [Kiritimatiellae bacterium]|nr:AAA family ATPase [Kiritimatiellia bacterium]
NPTEEHNKYLVLRFDFSAVSKDAGVVQADFDFKASLQCDTFARKYRAELTDELAERILKAPDCGKKLAEIATGLKETPNKLYVLIDEYDNFTNTILPESGLNAYTSLCHDDGFFKQFFTQLKAATSGTEAPVTRLFITGVSPVTMDDVTSGFNIGTNISLWSPFADLVGFSHEDIRAMCRLYLDGAEAERAERVCLEWFDKYHFGDTAFPPVANTTLVLNLFNQIVNGKSWPDDYIDENLRTDYTKIKHLVTLGHRLDASERKLNGNFGVLERLVSGGSLSEPLAKSFQAVSLAERQNFTSLLYWLGITTITGEKLGKTIFGIPNETLKKLAADMIPAAYSDVHRIDERVFDINDGLCTFAGDGNWRGFVDILAEIVKENFRVRDSIDGEKTVQSTMVALLCAAAGPYLVHHEDESGGGFYDIALEPQLSRWPEIEHAAIIELKYLKPGDPEPTPDTLATIKAKAIDQLDKYSADPTLRAKWHLAAHPNTQTPKYPNTAPVSLHRLVLVFKGGVCVLAEEV